MSPFAPRAVDCGLSTECEGRCATAQRTYAVAVSWQAPEVQKRLSFAYFSLPLQRKVGAAPHRGDASRPTRNRGCQQKKSQKRRRRAKKKPQTVTPTVSLSTSSRIETASSKTAS